MLPSIDPILPVLSKVVPTGKGWLYEPKLDGFRGVFFLENGLAFFMSKTKNRMRRFADLAAAVARQFEARSLILDGEIVVAGVNGPDFDALFTGNGEPQYAAFDLLYLNGKDLRALALFRRKNALARLLKTTSVAYVEPHDAPALYEATVRADLEGIVAKRRQDPYAPETVWMKVKNPRYSQKEGRAEKFHRHR